MLKDVLHNWGDEHCLKLLKNCYNVLPDKGKVIVLSCIMPEAPDSSIAVKYLSQADVLVMIHGGKQRMERIQTLLQSCRILLISTQLLRSFYANHGTLKIIVQS